MMACIGTLKELDVGVGDVVEYASGTRYKIYMIERGMNHRRAKLCEVGELSALSDCGEHHQQVSMSIQPKWRIISRANSNTKLWRDMTAEEKGALLLAAHEGKPVESSANGTGWALDHKVGYASSLYFRIKPEPKMETVTMSGDDIRLGGFIKGHRITFITRDGKPDCASIKMDEL